MQSASLLEWGLSEPQCDRSWRNLTLEFHSAFFPPSTQFIPIDTLESRNRREGLPDVLLTRQCTCLCPPTVY